jgi:L-fucose mutarotase
VIRADGLRVSDLLQAIIPLFELDSYAPPLVMMAAVEGDALDPRWNALSRGAFRPAPARISPASTALPSTSGRKSLCDRYHR